MSIERREEQLANQRAAFIAEASKVLASSLDYPATLNTVARLTVPALADWCAIDLVREDGSTERVALFPADSEKVLTSSLSVSLTARGRRLGALSFGSPETGRRFGPTEVAFAEELARRAAVAIDNARLYEEAEQRRREAEELARVARALTETLDVSGVGERIVASVLSLFRVESAALRLLRADGALVLVALTGPARDAFRPGDVLPAGVGTVGRAVVQGRPVWTSDALRESDITLSERLRKRMVESGASAILAVPLRVKASVIGVLSMADQAGRVYSSPEVALAQAFADQVAVAVERARLHEESERQRQEAEAANRAKDEFLAVLSHELRTPLTAMMGWARMLRSGMLDAETASRATEIIERNTRLQAQLINDLLDVSRIISGKLKIDEVPVDLVAVIEAAFDSTRGAAEAKDIEIARVLDPSTGLVRGDAARLQQVVWNLLSNAIKFTPRHGRVEVRLDPAEPHARILVRDTGRGIDPQFLPRIFDRFRQADTGTTMREGGLGLGLAIVRHIVELHSGVVTAESGGEGQGATFTVLLPVARRELESPVLSSPAAHEPPKVADEPAPVLAGIRVLVVEDESDTRDLLATSLAHYQANVRVVGSADEALTVFPTFRPEILVSDIRMPGKDGYALIREIRGLEKQRGDRIPAVALTAFASSEDRERALRADFDLHVAKPLEPIVLARAVARLVRRVPEVGNAKT